MKYRMRTPAYPAFGLTLVVNHACNLRCSYCYTGAKFNSAMPVEMGVQAIRRALASVGVGGMLNLGFFGGEPLIEAPRIQEWMQVARHVASAQGKQVHFNLTTNGTITDECARSILMDPDVEVAISCDGAPAQHDKHRRDAQGQGSLARVEKTLRLLVDAGRPFSVVIVVRPDTLNGLCEGLAHLREIGVTRFTLSIDVWTAWTENDLRNLAVNVDAAADLWRSWLPDVSIDWFDTRVAALAGLTSVGASTRCGFGEGEIAVAPSGRLYPCERLVGEDRPGHGLKLPGLVGDAGDFLEMGSPCFGQGTGCASSSGCRCSNYLRTGSTDGEDGLLRALDEAVHRSLERLITANTASHSIAGGNYHE
ncbi:radical SAM protein [Rariglobus hedericola]|uniref:Radical SAM protein n=2 Tax=Rariglobus hedericola TaxID=2597822 RepID=A0A556QK41_9BACT|nr:radical SAM protein [Rariglobus hedericola]